MIGGVGVANQGAPASNGGAGLSVGARGGRSLRPPTPGSLGRTHGPTVSRFLLDHGNHRPWGGGARPPAIRNQGPMRRLPCPPGLGCGGAEQGNGLPQHPNPLGKGHAVEGRVPHHSPRQFQPENSSLQGLRTGGDWSTYLGSLFLSVGWRTLDNEPDAQRKKKPQGTRLSSHCSSLIDPGLFRDS